MMKRRSNRYKRIAAVLMAAGLMMGGIKVNAAEDSAMQFRTKNTVVDAADCYVIVQDASGKYGLLDKEGEEVISCEYNDMTFPADTRNYDYVMVTQGSDKGAKGILDYDGNELVEVRYNSVGGYENGNGTATGYDKNKTHLYDEKGKETGELQDGKYTALSDSIFQSQENLKNENDKVILTFSEEGLLDEEGNAFCEKLGEYIAVDYFGSGDENDQIIIGQLKTENYIEIYDEDGELVTTIKPEESWTEDVEEGVYETGGVRLVEAVSDHTLEVMMTGFDDDYLIYDMDAESYSSSYTKIGEFTDGKAFALYEKDGETSLCIINETGEKISDGSIEISSYSRQDDESINGSFAVFIHDTEDENYKIYSLEQEAALDDTYKEVIATDSRYVIVKDASGDYGVLDAAGNYVVEAGTYGKDVLEQALYSDNCICVTETEGGMTTVNLYETYEVEEETFLSRFSRPVIIGIIAAVVVVIAAIIIILLGRKRKRKLEEEQKEAQQKEERKREEQRREAEKRKQMEARNRAREKEKLRMVHNEGGTWSGNPGKSSSQANSDLSGCLKGIRGEYAGKMIMIGFDKPFRIGRSHTGNDMVINNAKVSRHHCVISYDCRNGGRYIVKDLSSNGIYLAQGERLPKRENGVILAPGTVIYLGNEEVSFELKRSRSTL